MIDLSFYKGKKVFITGHTGFKGSWMCAVLLHAGAEVTGYALEPPTDPSLFALSGLTDSMRSVIGDVRDLDKLSTSMRSAHPDIAIHMAAQPIVRESYRDPVGTYSTNVMGTVHFLEAARQCELLRSIVNVTTDKVYQNNEWDWGYRETDRLDGFDPYSNSKSCSELVTSCYARALLTTSGGGRKSVSTCRAGNVIGGGDFAKDRIIPDCVRAMENGDKIIVRNPYSTRPYQHVLEPVCAYLLIAQKQYEDEKYAGHYNIGPDECDCVSTGALVDMFCATWGDGAEWINVAEENAPHEANFLKLDCSKVKKTFGWNPRWHVAEAVQRTVEWTKDFMSGGDIFKSMLVQTQTFMNGVK